MRSGLNITLVDLRCTAGILSVSGSSKTIDRGGLRDMLRSPARADGSILAYKYHNAIKAAGGAGRVMP